MSNAGRKLRLWTKLEIFQLHRLYAAGKSRAEMAAALGMEPERIRQRLQWEAQSNRLGIMRKRRRSAQRLATRAEQKSPRQILEMVLPGPKLTDKAIEERNARLAAKPRDLTGAFFNDPPIGYSALEHRT